MKSIKLRHAVFVGGVILGLVTAWWASSVRASAATDPLDSVISGRAVDAVTGQPITGSIAQVYVEASTHHGDRFWQQVDVPIAADGSFSYVMSGVCWVATPTESPCWLGHFTVRVVLPSGGVVPGYPGDATTWTPLPIAPGEHRDVGTIHLHPGGATLELKTDRLYLSDSSVAVPTLVDASGATVANADELRPRSNDLGSVGFFAFSDVYPGDYWLRADSAQDRAWYHDADPAQGDPAPIHVTDAGPVQLDTVVVRESAPTVDPGPVALSSSQPRVGDVLSVTYGPVVPATAGATYSWKSGLNVFGSDATMVVPPFLVGQPISVDLGFHERGYWSFSTTLTSEPVLPGLSTLAKPTVRHRPAVGNTLRAKAGAWTPACVAAGLPCGWVPTPAVSYQWLRDGKPLAGATHRDYVVRRSDRGHVLKVRTRATAPGYVPVSARSVRVLVG